MYTAKNYEHLLGTKGFSDELLKNHFKLYEGYVANTNKVNDTLRVMEMGTPEYSELKRRFGWEWSGMRLHELYFGNMSNDGVSLQADSSLAKALINEFGSLAQWEADFKATGAMRGIGWAILAHDTEGGRLFNVWINEHDLGHLAGATPLLVLDVFEHAFMLDYGLKRADYIGVFMNTIDWGEVKKRYGA